MADLKFAEDYDNENFDVLGYLEILWSREAFELNPPSREFLDDVYDIFNKIADDMPTGGKFMDFGCGPSIHMAIAGSIKFSHVVMTEYASQNRRAVMQWLKREDFGFDWTHVFEYFAKKENRSAAEIEQRTRKAIQEVLPCDTQSEAIFGVANLPQFDVIASCLCLEAGCSDVPSYKKAICQLANQLKPGGYFIQGGVFQQTKYEVKGKMFRTLPLNKKLVDEALEEAGFEPATWKVKKIETELEIEFDATEIFIIYVKKK